MQNREEQADEQKIRKTVAVLMNLLLFLTAEPEVVAAMSMEDVDSELKEMGIDPDTPIPASISETLTRIQATWEVDEESPTDNSSSPVHQVSIPAVCAGSGVSNHACNPRNKLLQENEIDSSSTLSNTAAPYRVKAACSYVISLVFAFGLGLLIAGLNFFSFVSLPRMLQPSQASTLPGGSSGDQERVQIKDNSSGQRISSMLAIEGSLDGAAATNCKIAEAEKVTVLTGGQTTESASGPSASCYSATTAPQVDLRDSCSGGIPERDYERGAVPVRVASFGEGHLNQFIREQVMVYLNKSNEFAVSDNHKGVDLVLHGTVLRKSSGGVGIKLAVDGASTGSAIWLKKRPNNLALIMRRAGCRKATSF